MKHKAWFLALVSILASTIGAGIAVIQTVSFDVEWQAQEYGLTNYVEGTNSAFNIYGTTNLGVPMTNWPFFSEVTNWTLGPTDTNGTWHTGAVMVLPAAQYFMALTSSNANGETGFSNPDHSGPIPKPSANLMIRHR